MDDKEDKTQTNVNDIATSADDSDTTPFLR